MLTESFLEGEDGRKKRGRGLYRNKIWFNFGTKIDFELGFSTGSWGSNNEILCSMFKWYIKFKM